MKSEPSIKSLRILVAESYPGTRDLLVEYLASCGHWVESCADAATTLARLNQDGFDVLLTHLRLPDAESCDFLAELSRRGHRPPRVVSMSGGDAASARRYSQSMGCVGHLVKPFQLEELSTLLR